MIKSKCVYRVEPYISGMSTEDEYAIYSYRLYGKFLKSKRLMLVCRDKKAVKKFFQRYGIEKI